MKYQIKQTNSSFNCSQIYKFILEKGHPHVLDPGYSQIDEWVKNGYSWVCDDGQQVTGHSALVPFSDKVCEIRSAIALNGSGMELYKKVFLPHAQTQTLLAVVKSDNFRGIHYFSQKCGFQEISLEKYQSIIDLSLIHI